MNRRIRQTTTLVLSFLLVATTNVSLAQSPLPKPSNATGSAVSDDAIKANIQERIKKAVEATSATDTLVTGWVATITSITNQNLEANVDNSLKQLILSPTTRIVDNNKPVNPQDLEIGTNVIAIGEVSNNDRMNVESIVTIKDVPQKSTKQSVLATVTDISTSKRQVTLLPQGAQSALTMTVPRSTPLTIAINGEKQTLTLQNLKEQDQVLVIYEADPDDDTQLDILLLHVTKPSLVETSPTPTPKIKPSPSSTPNVIREKLSE